MTEQHLLLAAHGRSLSKTESLSLVQIFLNASLACLAHTRELIPWMSPCLRTRYIDHIDPSVLVSDGSLYAELQALEPKDVAGGQEIRILVRGGHKRADQILEMLVSIAYWHLSVPSNGNIGEWCIRSTGTWLPGHPASIPHQQR